MEERFDIIRIKNAIFYAFHGVGQNEQELGGKFEIDVELYFSIDNAEENDNIKQTIDYEKVYFTISKIVTEKKFYLIESLAKKIAKDILNQFQLEKICVKVRKPHPPLKGVVDYVEAEIMLSKK